MYFIHGRYLGFFGDRIVQAVLHRYTQVLLRAANRFASVVAYTSMITLSTEYVAHFHDIYIHGKGNATMTDDSMKMLMLKLPFMVCDLVAPVVIISECVRVCTGMYWYVLQYNKYIRIYTKLSSSTRPSIMPRPGRTCAVCLMLLTPVTRYWTFSSSAWTGIWHLASPVFLSQSSPHSIVSCW
jgi:hypothetical protein